MRPLAPLFWTASVVAMLAAVLVDGLTWSAAILGGLVVALLLRAGPASRAAPPGTGSDGSGQEGREDQTVFADAIADPVIVLRGDRIVQVNRAALDRFGTHLEQEDVRVAFRHPALLEWLGGDATRGTASSIELSGLGGAGTWWEARAAPLPDDRAIVQFVDRTAVRAAERTRTDFVANASHELRTPLAAILGFVETLEGDAGGDAAVRRKFLSVVGREARRMQRLVEDLLSLSRIQSERFAQPRDNVLLAPLARQVAHDAATRDAVSGRRVEIEELDEVGAVVGDEVQLRQLLSNLVDNALAYGSADTPVRVTIALRDDQLCEVRVRNQGEVIAPEHLPRLTERFYRVDAGRSRRVGGTGLGLAIARHIVERHRGSMRITSVAEEGTTVAVRLPLAAGANAAPPRLSRN